MCVEGGVGVPGLKNSIAGSLCFILGDLSSLLQLGTLCFTFEDLLSLQTLIDRTLLEGLTGLLLKSGLTDLPARRPEDLGSKDMALLGLPCWIFLSSRSSLIGHSLSFKIKKRY